jgi:hypothetical protein
MYAPIKRSKKNDASRILDSPFQLWLSLAARQSKLNKYYKNE